MNHIIYFGVIATFGGLAGCNVSCVQTEAYHSLQASRVSKARLAMGGGGSRASLVKTEQGYRNRIELNFRDRSVSDSDIEHLRELDGIVGIDLSGTQITDEGLKVLATLPDLEYLQVADTEITTAGIQFLTEMHKLAKLDLRRTRIDAEAESVFRNMESLREIYSSGTPIGAIEGISVDSSTGFVGPYWGGTHIFERRRE